MEVVHIYHTNDLHSHFEHWSSIHHLLVQRREWHEQEGDEVFIFDIGDHMDRWHPYSDASRGKGNCRLLNEAGYDAVTIGNNEGITLSHKDLGEMYVERDFHVLAANLFDEEGKLPEWGKPYHIYRTKSGTRIAVIGLTVNFTHFYHLLQWRAVDPLIELENYLGKLNGEADVIVLLSHLGIHDDERIAEMFPQIDVIIGGHTHHILHEGKMVGHTLVCGAGKYGQYIGHITLGIDHNSKKAVTKEAILYDMNERPHPDDDKQAAMLYDTGKKMLDRPVAFLKVPLQTNPFENSELPSLLCRELKEWCSADAAFLNAGLLLGGLEGAVTEFDLLTVCPHPINPCTVVLGGAELKEVIMQAMDEKWDHMQIKGLGFRGTVMGKIVFAGISVQGREILIGGEPILPKAEYVIAIPDMFTFGRFFPEIYRSGRKTYFLPEFMRDLLRRTIERFEN
ncbi:bifunctional metallophosphatase/5'-nucleotidase [Mesobacillus zeae]|uniref:Bifunctional metallophosphatase/5'-nucleotidase n=1 Tax=Mesobacillus zeae TaxID=1917180 RepID=A0A398BK77_9BACI|nr:bifunctional UDP-sugar hydrolase/5'-nucleotidase [Mesobacillus zeae]RID88898.1 bifunctional metallophosphatase/5'-nucleotidase [Mesobacillus zeae]